MAATAALTTAENMDAFDKGARCVDLTDTLGPAFLDIQRTVTPVNWVHVTNEVQGQPIFDGQPEFGTYDTPNVETLLAVCKPSNFGKGDETLHDPAVRTSDEIVFTPEKSLFVPPQLDKRIREIGKEVFGTGKFTLVPDKLVVYSPGGHFDVHRDTVRNVDHVGTCVVALGGDFEGGALHFPTEDMADMADSNALAVFFTDIHHKVLPVTRGYRVVVTFRIHIALRKLVVRPKINEDECRDAAIDDEACDNDSVDDRLTWHFGTNGQSKFADQPFVVQLLEELKKRPGVIFGCRHLVPAAALATGAQGLRGVDRELAEQLTTLNLRASVVVVRVDMELDVYDGSDRRARRAVDAMSDDASIVEVLQTKRVGFVRAPCGDHFTLKSTDGADYTGNESAPRELQYITVGMFVAPRDEQ